MKHFFVLGLPRSRTAWLSNFLTYDGHFCYHEGLDSCRSIAEYKAKLYDPDYESVGDSCTGLMMIDIEKEFPDSLRLIVENDLDKSARESYALYEEKYPDCYRNVFHKLEIAEERLNKISGLRIHVSRINDNLELIWNYLLGGRFDQKRADLLAGKKIEVFDPYDYNLEGFNSLIKEEPCHF